MTIGRQGMAHIVTAIDSVFIWNGYRKRFIMEGGYMDSGPDTIIEGIGSLIDLFFTIDEAGFEADEQLDCFKQNDTLLFQRSNTCYVYTNVTELIKEKLMFKLSPNPAHENFTLEINTEIINGSATLTTSYEIKIFNVLGENVLTERLNGKKEIINCKNLPHGIYFYKITNEKREMIGNGKIVVSDF